MALKSIEESQNEKFEVQSTASAVKFLGLKLNLQNQGNAMLSEAIEDDIGLDKENNEWMKNRIAETKRHMAYIKENGLNPLSKYPEGFVSAGPTHNEFRALTIGKNSTVPNMMFSESAQPAAGSWEWEKTYKPIAKEDVM